MPTPLIRPRLFDPLDGIVAGFSTREGGISEAPYQSLNLGLSTGDDDDHIRTNRDRFTEALGLDRDAMAIAGQVHGTDVAVVEEPGLHRRTDGLVTATPGVLLSISAADCAAVLLADASAGVVGACHAGWRGAAGGIVGVAVDVMEREGARRNRIRAYVSPCIGLDAFEVGEEVAEQFEEAFVVRREDWPKPHVDLKASIASQLRKAGVPGSLIEVSRHSTYEETGRFFSYRAEGGTTGRMMGAIALT